MSRFRALNDNEILGRLRELDEEDSDANENEHSECAVHPNGSDTDDIDDDDDECIPPFPKEDISSEEDSSESDNCIDEVSSDT